MSSVKFDVLWSPSAADLFIKYGTSLDLYQVEKRSPGQTHRGPVISDDYCAVHVATNSEINLIKCVAWYPKPEPRNLLAVGHANGKVVLTSFGNIEHELIGKEFLHNAKHSRQCSYLSWNPDEPRLLAEGFSERYRNDPCIVIWDIFAVAGADLLSSTERPRHNTNTSEWGVVSKPMYEIGSGDTSTSFCWFVSESKTFVTGINNKQMRVYDMRDLTKPHLQNQHKGVYGLCVDPLFDKQLATFGENQVSVWDLRSFEKPVLTLQENKAVVKISWCSTRSGMLSVLCKDNNIIKLYDIRHSVFGMDVMEPALVERNIQPCKDSVISSFTWHPSHENRLLSVASSGEVRDTIVFERIPMIWSPSSHLAWACGKRTMDCVRKGEIGEVDISSKMYQRVKKGYGMEMNDLDSVSPAIKDEPNLHGMWKWLFSIKDYMKLAEANSTPVWIRGFGIKSLLKTDKLETDAPENTHGTWTGMDGMINHYKIYKYSSPERSKVLQLCGWGGDEDRYGSLRELLDSLQSHGFYEKAAALALFNLQLRQSIEILTFGASKSPEHANLNAVAMALSGFSDQKSTLWQKTCSSLRNHLYDPYLRAMFAFITSDRQQFKDVLSEPGMAVEDKVAFACNYLPENKLLRFIEDLTRDLKASGNLDGIMLTGMTAEGIDLLENYVDDTCDIQTAALALLCAFPQPLAQDERIRTWIESYRSLLDRWRLWHHRAKFDILYHKSDPTHRIPSQVFVSCNFCSKSITSTSTMIARSTGYNTHVGRATAYKPRVSCCPSCRKSLPRCALCRNNLGTASGTGVRELKGHPSKEKVSKFDNWFTWCQSCRHGGHSAHVLSWFKDHSECPVTDCACKCMKIDSLRQILPSSSQDTALASVT